MAKATDARPPERHRTAQSWWAAAAIVVSGWFLELVIVRVGLGVTDALPYGRGSEFAYIVLATLAGLSILAGTTFGIAHVWRARRSGSARKID